MYLDIFMLYLYRKTEKNETKNGHFAECISQNTRQSGLHSASRTAALPSAKLLALGKAATWGHRGRRLCRVPDADTRQKFELCRVSAVRHSTKPKATVAPRGGFAECQGSRQTLCRVPEFRHSAKPPLPPGALPKFGSPLVLGSKLGHNHTYGDRKWVAGGL